MCEFSYERKIRDCHNPTCPTSTAQNPPPPTPNPTKGDRSVRHRGGNALPGLTAFAALWAVAAAVAVALDTRSLRGRMLIRAAVADVLSPWPTLYRAARGGGSGFG
jgi:hypothetical protein